MAGGRSRRRSGSAAAIAAGLAACLVLAVGSGAPHHGSRDGTRLSAPIGQMRHQTLADGSQVTLNTDTILEVRYGGGTRNVRLIRGEAFFDVAHDPSRPFLVESRAGSARVLGTAFDVRLRGRAARVSVLRGAVQVEPAGGGGRAVVQAGQWAWLDEDRPQAQALEDPVAVDAWRRGRLVVYRRPLAEVVAEINRYRRGRIILRGEALESTTVSGVFDITKPETALDALVASLDLRTARLGGFVLVY
jgi:transmembrane sensor